MSITKQFDVRDRQDGPDTPAYSKSDRDKYITLGIASIICLSVARALQASPGGVGTHTQLGLPPCSFLHLTGIPCPACGLTTSVAHAARFHFYESMITQPFGLVVFIAAVLTIPLSICFMRRRVPLSKIKGFRGRKPALYLMTAFFILSWLYKIAAMKGLFGRG